MLVQTGWQIGATAAPMMGAVLAHPERKWPGLFRNTIFERYPYSLPCVAVSAVPLITTFFAAFLAEETHPGIRAGSTNAEYSKILQSPESPKFDSKTLPPEEEPSLLSSGAGFVLLLRVSYFV